MKKFLLGLFAILGMALCFTACGDNKEDEQNQADPTETGASLYDSYTKYQEAGDDEAGTIAKASAALNLYNAYKAYESNKEDSEWKKTFASSAVSAVTGSVDKTELATNLLTKLEEANVTSDGSTNKVLAVAELASALSSVFGGNSSSN